MEKLNFSLNLPKQKSILNNQIVDNFKNEFLYELNSKMIPASLLNKERESKEIEVRSSKHKTPKYDHISNVINKFFEYEKKKSKEPNPILSQLFFISEEVKETKENKLKRNSLTQSKIKFLDQENTNYCSYLNLKENTSGLNLNVMPKISIPKNENLSILSSNFSINKNIETSNSKIKNEIEGIELKESNIIDDSNIFKSTDLNFKINNDKNEEEIDYCKYAQKRMINPEKSDLNNDFYELNLNNIEVPDDKLRFSKSNTLTRLCRICYESDQHIPLIQPCKCEGSVKLIHEICLKKWLDNNKKGLICELCKSKFYIKFILERVTSKELKEKYCKKIINLGLCLFLFLGVIFVILYFLIIKAFDLDKKTETKKIFTIILATILIFIFSFILLCKYCRYKAKCNITRFKDWTIYDINEPKISNDKLKRSQSSLSSFSDEDEKISRQRATQSQMIPVHLIYFSLNNPEFNNVNNNLSSSEVNSNQNPPANERNSDVVPFQNNVRTNVNRIANIRNENRPNRNMDNIFFDYVNA